MCPNHQIAFCLCLLAAAAVLYSPGAALADIYQWEWIDPDDPSQGKQESTMLCPDGAGVSAVPFYPLSGDLTKAYLIGANLAYASPYFYISDFVIFTDADLSQANLTNANFGWATVTGADFTNAEVRGADFRDVTGLTEAQLQSTASYRAKDLSGIRLFGNDLTGWDFHEQNLTNARLCQKTLFYSNRR